MSSPQFMPFTLRNPIRVITPLATAVLSAIMFFPPLLLADWSGPFQVRIGLGVSILLLVVLLFVRAGFKAPFAMRIEPGGLYVRRLMRETRYGIEDVRSWKFAVPDAPSTQEPPSVNGLLFVTFADRTRFRAEVTRDEALMWISLLEQPR